MFVTDIQIANYRYCSGSGRHIANVGVTLRDQFISLFCQLDLPEDECPDFRARALVGEALRQLARMPEYRSGKTAFHVADHLNEKLPRQTA